MGESNLVVKPTSELDAPMGGGAGGPAPEGMSIVLIRQWPVVAITLGVCLSLAALYLLFATPLYTSTAKIAYQFQAVNDAASMPDNTSYLFTQQEIMTSSAVLDLVLGKLKNEDMHVFDGVDNQMLFMKKEVRVDVGKKNALISISFDAADPKEAKIVVDAVVAAYNEYQSIHQSAQLAEFMNKITETTKAIEEKTNQLIEYRSNHKLLAIDMDTNNLKEALDSINKSLVAAHMEVIRKQISLDEAMKSMENDPEKIQKVNDFLKTGKGLINTQGELTLLQEELAQLHQKMAEMERQRFLPTHPSVQALQAKMDELSIQYTAAVKKRYMAAKDEENTLQANFNKIRDEALQMDKVKAEYSAMEKEINRLEGQLATVNGAVGQLRKSSPAQESNVIEKATVALKPSKPNRILVMAGAMLAGLCLGWSFAKIRDVVTPQLRSAAEVRAALDLPILAGIPHQIFTEGMALDRMSDVGEAFADLRAAIMRTRVPEGSKTILITAPASDQGTSTVVNNLARIMAESGDRVLVIDTDFHNPSQDQLFRMQDPIMESQAGSGLSTILQGEHSADDAIRHTEVRGLDVIPTGPLPDRPVELLKSQIFEELLKEMSGRYDWVLIDSSPTSEPDARVVSAACEATVLVLRAHKCDRRLSEHAHDALLSVGAQIIGIVINDIPRRGGWRVAPYTSERLTLSNESRENVLSLRL